MTSQLIYGAPVATPVLGKGRCLTRMRRPPSQARDGSKEVGLYRRCSGQAAVEAVFAISARIGPGQTVCTGSENRA